MTDTYDDPIPAPEVEEDIRDMASKLRPALGSPFTVPARDIGTPTASLIAKRLEQAITTAHQIEKTATVLSMAICGPSSGLNSSGSKAAPAPDYLFGRQAAALDELQVVHERIRAVLERIGAALR